MLQCCCDVISLLIQNIIDGQELPVVDLLVSQNNNEVVLNIKGNTNIEVNWWIN